MEEINWLMQFDSKYQHCIKVIKGIFELTITVCEIFIFYNFDLENLGQTQEGEKNGTYTIQ